jgi:tetratricopeptide (TPR) repeat protein
MQHDPLREAGYRSAMELLGRRGQRAEALRLYHRCVQVLDRELSVAPSPDTVAVYERLRSTSPTDPPVDDRRPIPSARRARLIGRGAELDRILGAWERTRGGGSGVVLVTGEPGVGKSRLVAEASRMIGSRGAVVAATRSYESAARAPWGPVAEWLRSEPLRGRVARLEPTWRSHVARLTPDLVPDSFDVAAGPDAVTNGRRLLLDALVAALATSTPTMLVLDDLQWCDDDTIELVGRLATVPSPLLVVLTARSVELELHQRASALVGELRRDGGLVEIDLEPLDRTSTIELAREVTCAGDDVDLTRWWDETEGNPLFVVELARASLADAGAGPQVLPATVRAVIDSRLGQLGQAARQVAEVAATIGRGFESSVITMVTGQSDDELVDPLDELWRLRVIREQGTGYDFSHDKVREVLLRSIGPARLRRLHREIADALERLSGDDLGPSSREIARHRAAAGLHAAAADAYRRTARVAADLWALPDAVECLEQALRCLAELPATPERFATEAEVNIELAVALVQLTGWGSERTLAAYERAAALRRRCRVPVDPAIIRGLGVAHVLRCDLHRALTYATELLDLAGDDVMVAVEGHYLLGVTHSWRGDHALAEEHLRAAIERYDPARGADHVVHFAQDPRAICLVRLSLTRLWRGDVAGAEHLMAQAVAHAEAIDHPWTQVYVLVWQFMLAVELGDIDRAARAVEQLELSHERYGDLAYMLSIDSAARGWCDAHVDPHRGAELLRRSLGDWRDSVQPLHYTWVAQLLAALCLRTDAIDEGRAVLAEALRFADDSEQRYIEPSLWITEAELRHRAGDAVGAQRALEEALSVAGRQGAEWYADVARSRLDAMSSRA